MKKTILELDNISARKLFMRSESYCTLQLPKYFDFTEVLSFVKQVIGNKNLQNCLAPNPDKQNKKVMISDYDDVNYKILANKDGRYAVRPFELINPFYYYFLICLITKKENWANIQRRFNQFSDEHFQVVSIPCVTKEKTNGAATAISNWYTDYEQRSIELSLDYRYMFVTDITNCYGSIYTHAIAWALHDKPEAKKNKKDNKLLGNEIDTYIRRMQSNQTNGIPQGNMCSNFIAEVILGYADMQLAEALRKEDISKYKVLRYRDDYRIFSNNKVELERIAIILQKVLNKLNFQLNSSKTKVSENIIQDSIKKDKLLFFTKTPIYYNVNNEKEEIIESCIKSAKTQLFYILQVSSEFPNSPTVQKLLNNFYYWYTKHYNRENVYVLTALLTELFMHNPRSYQVLTAILSSFLGKINVPDKQSELLSRVYNRLSNLPNQGFMQLYLQRITTKIQINTLPYTEKLCKIVDGVSNVRLWNNDWLDRRYTENFPIAAIVNKDILQKMQPIMSSNEFNIFEYQ